MAFQTPITIKEAVESIHYRKFFLPAIQREFVWKPDRIERLFDSILQGFPINSFLFWEVKHEKRHDYQFYEFIKDYVEEIGEHNEKAVVDTINGNFTAILDGQQRLTSFYIGLMGSYGERYYKTRKGIKANYFTQHLYLNIASFSDEENKKYQFRFLESNQAKEASEHTFWYRVSDILQVKDMTDINNFIFDKKLNENRRSFNILFQLYEAINKTPVVNYFLEKSDELDKVLNIFIRINSGGISLSYSDMLFSTAAAQWTKKDAREEINNLFDKLRDSGFWGISKDWILKACLYLTGINDIRFKVDNFNKSNMLLIENEWDKIKLSLLRTVELARRFGYDYNNIYSYNAFLPIAYYLHKYQPDVTFHSSSAFRSKRQEISKWLNITTLKRTFSGQPDTVLIAFRKCINDQTDFDYLALRESVKNTNKNLFFSQEEIDSLFEIEYGDKRAFTFLSIVYGNPDFEIKPHLDHIHPGNTVNFEDPYNTVLNLQLLAGQENIEKLDENFGDWFYRNFPQETQQKDFKLRHYLPDVDYSPTNFNEFVKGRKILLEEKVDELINLKEKRVE